jgi:hypothetical protein
MTPRRPFTLTRGELAAIISRLDRSRAGGAATGSFLENLSKLLQVLAIVGGGAWVLLDYFEFKKTNNELTNKQLELALKTAELSQSSTMLNNQLNQLKLTRTVQGRLEVGGDSSVVRSAKFPDDTFLYRLQITLKVKNISDSTVSVPAVVTEQFIGKTPVAALKSEQAFLVNVPSSWLRTPTLGSVEWSRVVAVVQRVPDQIDEEIEKQIANFPLTPGGLLGEIRSGELANWTASFVLKARSEDMVGAVATFWVQGEDGLRGPYTFTYYEILSEAEDAHSLKTEGQLTGNQISSPAAGR